jgi:4-amino-4-deoxy-L-arabinose transferase-like glycosyltransferase
VALFVAPLIGGLPLLDPDEGLHASIAQEMVERGDYLTPRFLGVPFLDKPILFFWAQAFAIATLGSHAAAIRGVGLLFGVLGGLATALLARRLFGNLAGALAFPIYTTTMLPAAISQAAVHDIALVPWIALALLAFVDARSRRSTAGALACAALAGVWLGLAVLTKGLVGVAMAGMATVAWLAATRALDLRMVLAGALGLAVACAVAAPWYLAMERANPGYLHYFLVERHFLGFTTGTQPHGDRPWFYYLPIVLAGGLPWMACLPWSRGRSGEAPTAVPGARTLAWAWLVGGVVFVSLASSKLVTYVLPVFPAIALLASATWAGWLSGAAPVPGRGALAVWAGAIGMATLLAVAVPVAGWFFSVDLPPVAHVVSVALALAWFLPPLAWRRRGPAAAFVVTLALAGVTLLVAARAVVPPVATALTARELAQAINARGTFPARLWVLGDRVGSLIFYLDPTIRGGLTPDRVPSIGLDRLLGARRPPPDTLVAVSHDRLGALTSRVPLDGVPFEQAGHYRLYTAEAIVEAVDRRLRSQ